MIETSALGRHSRQALPLSSVIYYLVTPESFSGLHWLAGEEVWTFILGDPLQQLVLFPDGSGEVRSLGNSLETGCLPISVVPPDCWQGTRLESSDGGCGYALCSTVMSPAFDGSDFRMGDGELTKLYPDFANEIRRFLG
jgi:predicted cupin superfamily sugar epimerase